MTSGAGLSLDHVGFMVRDLDLGAEAWRRLGFTLSSRSRQMGRVPGEAEMAPWATSNHCVMFEQGYLELIGVTHPAHFNPWTRFLDRFEGPHIVALRCADADEAYASLSRRTDGFDPPLQRLRSAPYGDGVRPFRFRNIFSQDDRYPEGRFIIIEHQTPEVIWQPDLMVHPNTAVRLAELRFFASDPGPTVDRLRAITGETAAVVDDGTFVFRFPDGSSLSVLDREAVNRCYPGLEALPDPAVVAAVIEVADLSAAGEILAGNGVTVHALGGGAFRVSPEAGNGGVLEFRAARS